MNTDFLFRQCLEDACKIVENGPALESLDDDAIAQAITAELLQLYRIRGERLGIEFD